MLQGTRSLPSWGSQCSTGDSLAGNKGDNYRPSVTKDMSVMMQKNGKKKKKKKKKKGGGAGEV